MRREHSAQQSYIEWLKSLGCVFYCPFDLDNGTMDLINNVPMQLSGNGSIVYDAGENMYLLTVPLTYNQYVGIWNNGISPATFTNDEFSVLYTLKKITSTSSLYMNGVGANTYDLTTYNATCPSWAGTQRTNAFPATVCKTAYTDSLIERSSYNNGVLLGTSAPYAPYHPSNWVTSGSGLLIGNVPNSNKAGVQMYISEVYIFNTILDIATIRHIQGYE